MTLDAFIASVKSTAMRYMDFAGRASQAEYWYWFAFSILVSIVAAFVAQVVGLYLLALLVRLLLLVPSAALFVRRLFDAGKPSNWAIAAVVLVGLSFVLPYIGQYNLASLAGVFMLAFMIIVGILPKAPATETL